MFHSLFLHFVCKSNTGCDLPNCRKEACSKTKAYLPSARLVHCLYIALPVH